MKALLIAVLVLFTATGASWGQERHRGGNDGPRGPNAVSGQRGGSGGNWHNRGGGGGGGVTINNYRGGGGWHGGSGYRGDWAHRNDEFAGGILGGLLGGAISGWLQPEPEPPVVYVQPPAPQPPALEPWTPDWVYYCSHKYKSFNPETGNFTGYDGVQYFCH